ncbi:hypothetical protein [Rhodococcus sp. NCIMB 12038]|uniref:hypothetical protein n=1 Tax=Rhodococcus sp. NCIMB 12038 TaxID=933800 RepID=UPI00117B3B4D|nr:hypothetical protein [Rhodococcus sp. NCIMB 12038]
MDKYNLALIEFYRRWEPFGGPPASEILAQFGLSENQFHARYRALTRNRKGARVPETSTGSREQGSTTTKYTFSPHSLPWAVEI